MMCGWLSDEAVWASRWNRSRPACGIRQAGREKLDGDRAIESGVEREVHDTHAPSAEDRLQAVQADGGAGTEIHARSMLDQWSRDEFALSQGQGPPGRYRAVAPASTSRVVKATFFNSPRANIAA
jgi:hypothetical protein